MFCSKCGAAATAEAQFCASCGAKLLGRQAQPAQEMPLSDPVRPSYVPSETPNSSGSNGLGSGIAGLILAVLTIAFGFYDYGAVMDGEYSYIALEEIGFLGIMSVLGIIFGSVSAAKKSTVGYWALSLSIFGFLLTLFLSQYSA
jgi:hypothetical protein